MGFLQAERSSHHPIYSTKALKETIMQNKRNQGLLSCMKSSLEMDWAYSYHLGPCHIPGPVQGHKFSMLLLSVYLWVSS